MVFSDGNGWGEKVYIYSTLQNIKTENFLVWEEDKWKFQLTLSLCLRGVSSVRLCIKGKGINVHKLEQTVHPPYIPGWHVKWVISINNCKECDVDILQYNFLLFSVNPMGHRYRSDFIPTTTSHQKHKFNQCFNQCLPIQHYLTVLRV